MDMIEKKRYTVGVMLGDIQSDYSESLLSGFYTCAKEEDVNLIFLMGPQAPLYCSDILSSNNNGHYRYQFDTIFDYVRYAKVDALIIAYGSLSMSTRSEDMEAFLNTFHDIPYLLLEDIPEHPNAPYLIADNYSGIHCCMEHLIEFHHYRKIAFVCGPRSNKDSNERLAAYLDTMAEHNLTVTDDMIVYGDYSENIDTEVEYLLEKNPDLEAIAFANDNMAKAGYRVCTNHNLLIGKDIAITGFDNVDFAQFMTPPLTSISHCSFQFSYTALKNTLLLCQGKTPVSKRMPVTLHKRCSCGCAPAVSFDYKKIESEQLKDFMINSANLIAKDVLSAIPDKSSYAYYTSLICNFFSYIYRHAFITQKLEPHDDYLVDILNHLLNHPHISSELILEHFTGLLRTLLTNAENPRTQEILSATISTLHQYIHSKDITSYEQMIKDSTRKSWFVPTFTMDLITDDISFKEVMNSIMERFRLMHIRGAYFYLFEKPIHFHTDSSLVFTENLFLTAFYNPYECHYYEKEERPLLQNGTGFSSFLLDNHQQCLTAFVLFSGDEQYGIALCDLAQTDIAFVQTCSLQIGSLLRFFHLNSKEKQIQTDLQHSLKIIQEQNNILSFISEYDELTGLLNRRGFMERAISLCKDSTGKHAYLLFGDLDHLKEINDCFGHACGDFAIRTAAGYLTDNLPDDSLIARIGGDEYLALILTEELDFPDIFCKKLKAAEDNCNASSTQPFYVELSIGIESFICHPQIDLNEIIKKSDEILYQAKQRRRKTIKK